MPKVKVRARDVKRMPPRWKFRLGKRRRTYLIRTNQFLEWKLPQGDVNFSTPSGDDSAIKEVTRVLASANQVGGSIFSEPEFFTSGLHPHIVRASVYEPPSPRLAGRKWIESVCYNSISLGSSNRESNKVFTNTCQ